MTETPKRDSIEEGSFTRFDYFPKNCSQTAYLAKAVETWEFTDGSYRGILGDLEFIVSGSETPTIEQGKKGFVGHYCVVVSRGDETEKYVFYEAGRISETSRSAEPLWYGPRAPSSTQTTRSILAANGAGEAKSVYNSICEKTRTF